jgi:hypothetical protein
MSANKILFKYIHVWSCFKGFTVRNIMVQPEYNLDTYFHPGVMVLILIPIYYKRKILLNGWLILSDKFRRTSASYNFLKFYSVDHFIHLSVMVVSCLHAWWAVCCHSGPPTRKYSNQAVRPASEGPPASSIRLHGVRRIPTTAALRCSC